MAGRALHGPRQAPIRLAGHGTWGCRGHLLAMSPWTRQAMVAWAAWSGEKAGATALGRLPGG